MTYEDIQDKIEALEHDIETGVISEGDLSNSLDELEELQQALNAMQPSRDWDEIYDQYVDGINY